jgi:hypothetical protein
MNDDESSWNPYSPEEERFFMSKAFQLVTNLVQKEHISSACT